MKKILILLLSALLCACSAKTISWQDVQDSLSSLQTQAEQTAQVNEDFLENDYRSLLDQIASGLDSLESGIKEETQESAQDLYLNASVLEALAAQFNSEEAGTLKKFSQQVKDLVKAAYEKNSDFAKLKSEASSLLSEIRDWDSSAFASVLRKKKILWSQVEEDYAQLESATIDALPRPEDVSELQLEEYKNTIINNYEAISNGVNEDNRINADVIYEAAVALHEYTYRMNSVDADKVNRFALQSMDYVKECYGEKIDDPDYDFLSAAQQASRWTLSLWNELVKLLNM